MSTMKMWRFKSIRRGICVFLVLAGLSGSSPAFGSGAIGSGSLVYDPSNWLENATTAANSASMIANQLQMIYYTAKDMQSMPASTWTSASGLMMQLGNIAGMVSTLGYSAQMLSTQFQANYPGYTPSQNYSGQYAQTTQSFSQQLGSDLSEFGMQAAALSSSAAQLQYLNSLNTQGISGKLQALQVGTSVATLEASTLQQMETLQMQQAQEQRLYMAHKVQSKAAQEAAGQCFTQSGFYGVGNPDGSVSPPPEGCNGPCVATHDAFGDQVYTSGARNPACSGVAPPVNPGNTSSGTTRP